MGLLDPRHPLSYIGSVDTPAQLDTVERVKGGSSSLKAAPALSFLALVCAIVFVTLGVSMIVGYLRNGPSKTRTGLPVRTLILMLLVGLIGVGAVIRSQVL